ncbi:COG3762 Predicted membrane protein [Sphingomonadaceae bacterium]
MAIRKISHVSEDDHRLVSAAVAEAEQHTSGEIVTIVSDMSDDYDDAALVWASVITFLALSVIAFMPDFYLGLLHGLFGGWDHDWTASEYLALLFLFLGGKWLGSWALMQWTPLRLALTPKHIKMRRVRARAIELFRVGTESKTTGRTGVLLYLSMREHRAEIVADAAIAGKVAPEIWGDAMIALVDHVREGRPGEGMAEAVRQMGGVLAEHFPKGSENPNELPDRLIEI